jgi:hypothetical protein
MKHARILIPIVVVALAGPARDGFAQGYSGRVVQGMFGPRVIGRTLEPPQRQWSGGIKVSEVGAFMGMVRPEGRLMFNLAQQSGPALVRFGVPLSPEQTGGTSPLEAVQPGTPQQAPGTELPWDQQMLRSGGLVPANPSPVPGGSPSPQAAPPAGGSPTPGGVPPGTATGATSRPAQWMRTPGPAGTPGETTSPTGATPAAAPAAVSPRMALPQLSMGSGPLPPASDAGATLSALLERSRQIQKRSPISVTVKDYTAILRGRVATEHDRSLAAALLLLEPGIWEVQNELVVESPPPVPQGVSAR